MKAVKPILILCMALCFASSCKKEVDMTLVQKTVYENTDISLFHVDDAWEVSFVYDSLNSFVELEYSAYLEEYVSAWDTNSWLNIGFKRYVYKQPGSVFKATAHISQKEALYIMADNASVIHLEGSFELEDMDIDLRHGSICNSFDVSSHLCSISLTDGSQIYGVEYHGTNCSVYAYEESCCKGFFDVEQTFNAGVYGLSQLVVFGGSMTYASVEAKNAFTVNLSQAEVNNMYVYLADASESTVNVTDTISGFLLSGSTLYYKGHPEIEVDCSDDSQLVPF